MLDGGVGSDTLDFSKVSGRISIDLDHHTAVVSDATTGAVIARDSVLRFERIIGTDVVHVLDTVQGTLVSVLAGGKFHEIAILDNVHTSSLLDLGMLV